jgi:hypothetical protein
MTAPRPPASPLDRFAEDIRHDGSGRVFRRSRGLWQRLADLPFSWLAFPLVSWLLRRGLLRMALALSFVAAPVLAAGFILADGWMLWRARRRRRQLNPG